MKSRIRKSLFLLFVLFTTLIPSEFLAATKTVDVEIEKSYNRCTFKAVCETAGDYSISLFSPKGEEYAFDSIDNQIYTCVVKNVKSGTWRIVISEDSFSVIGKVSVSVSAAKKEDGDIKDDISVGKDIAGLTLYLKNNSVVANWTDENCGAVSFRVTNLDTSELISNEKVNEKSFECVIPDNAKNISVEVTPSSSNGINGATATYILHKNSFNGMVTYPEFDYVNMDKISASVNISEPYGFCVEINGKSVLKEDTQSAGNYTFSIPLENEGENLVQFYLVDKDGNMSSFDKTFIKDIIAPSLSLAAEYDGMQTEEESTIIEGTVTDFKEFTINKEPVTVSTDGYFSYECLLHQGNNLITLVAKDIAGNEAIYNINIFVPEKQNGIPPYILLIVAILILFFVFKKDKGDKNNKKSTRRKDDSVEDDNFDNLDLKDKPFTSEGLANKNANMGDLKPNLDISMDEFREEKTKKAKKTSLLTFLNTSLGKNKNTATLVGILLFVVFLNFILGISHITSGSMEPTLNTNDFMVYNRLAYVKNEVSYGDIISFNKEDDIYCKRVIGLSGDDISFYDGYLYRNGERVEEHYIESDIETNCTKTFTVPENCIFVLGDNRENSYDSRYWKSPYVSVSDINGKLLFIIPFGK